MLKLPSIPLALLHYFVPIFSILFQSWSFTYKSIFPPKPLCLKSIFFSEGNENTKSIFTSNYSHFFARD